jgi:hypothetical protein
MRHGGVTTRASILSGLRLCLADLISPPKVSVLDGCPMFAPAYMGRKRIFQMLSLQVRGSLLLAAVFLLAMQDRWKGLRPVFFGPCTLGRTWGTRPGGGLRSLLYPQRCDGLHLDSVCSLPIQLVTVMISSLRQALDCGRYAVSAITVRAAREITTPATTTSASAARNPTTPDKDPTAGGPTRNPK